MKEFYPKLFDQGLDIQMIADDQGDLRLELPHLAPQEQVVEAVGMAGYKDGQPGNGVGEVKVPGHLKLTGHVFEDQADFLPGDDKAVEFPFDAHEEDLSRHRSVLRCVDDVPIVAIDEIGDVIDESLLVLAGEKQDGIGTLIFTHYSLNIRIRLLYN